MMADQPSPRARWRGE